MLNGLIRFALQNRLLIVLLSLAVMVYGGFLAATIPIDVFPDLDRPRVVLLTEAPGMAPEEVETLISFPLEAALLGANGVQAVRSQSGVGLAVIYVEFDWGMSIHLARQTVQERLAAAADALPPGIRPQLAPISSIMGQIMVIGMQPGPSALSDPRMAMRVRTLADWVARPRLLKIPGVAQVVVMGGDRKQYHVLVNAQALLDYNVTLQEIESALRNNNLSASGGFLTRGDREWTIRVLGRLGPEPAQVIEEINQIPLQFRSGRSLQIRHVAEVKEAPQLKRGDAGINGSPGVLLTVVKQPHVDTRHLTDQLHAALDDMKSALARENIVFHTELFQLKRFIDHGIANVAEALLIGAGLVLIILFLFLLNFRTTLITLTAIPLSLAITALVFKLIGWVTGTPLSLNVMTLGGIAVAMGELVDDAIVDVENIFRRLKENAQRAAPLPILGVIYHASVEIRGAIVFGTMMVILVFFPLFALSGVEGRLFTPLAVAYIVSILASLLVSLTVTPVLSFYLLPRSRAVRSERESALLRFLKWLAGGVIYLSLHWIGTLLMLTWMMVLLSGWLLMQLGADFLPPFDEGSVQVNLSLPPGSSLAASLEACQQADQVFSRLLHSPAQPDGVLAHYFRRTGRAEMDEHVEPVSNTEYILTIHSEAAQHREEVLQRILTELKDHVPGVDIEVEQPLAHLISHMLSGVTAQVAIKVFGDDLTRLRQTAERIQQAIQDVPGVSSLAVEAQKQVEELHIRLLPRPLAHYGLDRAYVAEFLTTALKGEELLQVMEGERRFDLVVWLDERYRHDIHALKQLRLDLPGQRGQVALSELAVIEESQGANVIHRENARRRIVIRCNALGRDLASVVRDIQERVRGLQKQASWPIGYFVEYGGQFESQRRATILISLLAGLAIVGMFVVLYKLYPSVRIVLQILHALPVAFIGGVLALALTRQTLSVASMVGFISLGGIAARNGILLVSHYFHLMRHEREGFTQAMLMRGSLERLAPVLMTALTAGFALLPLVFEGQKPGREILYPIATVILGGLFTSTFCEYLLHPGLFWKFSGRDVDRLLQADVNVWEGNALHSVPKTQSE